MNLKFIIDKPYDSQMVYWFLENATNKPDFLLAKLGLTWESIKNMSSNKMRKKIRPMIDEKYKTLRPYLKKTVKIYQTSWDEINNEIFKTIEKITGYKWKYKIYYCVVSPFHRGISNWGGNKIIRNWQENSYTMRKITTHELLISHIFTIFEKDFQKEGLEDKEKWAIAEISAWAICGLEKKMLKFWPWITEEEKFPLDHNYPELYKLQKALKPKYENKKSFNKFLDEAIFLIRK